MINTLDEALEQNKVLVTEAFRTTQQAHQWREMYLELKSNKDSNDESTTRQEEVKNLQELNKRFVSQTQQANSKVLELQNLLATKEAELASLKVQFKKTEEMDDLQHALELAAQLKEKEKLISLNSAEILLKDRLLEDAELHNQKLNNERVKLCQLLQNTKKEAQSGQKHKVSDENGSMQFEAILATKESELQDLKFQNHNLANVVLSLENHVHEMEKRSNYNNQHLEQNPQQDLSAQQWMMEKIKQMEEKLKNISQ